MTQSKQDTMKHLIYITIALLFINFILLFLPFMKVYQPSYSKTVLGVTTYTEWYTQSAPLVMFIFPIFFTGIPYLCSVISIATSFKKKNNKNKFFRIKNNAVDKPIKFFWLKFGAIANAIAMWIVYSKIQSKVSLYDEYGAYCNITFFGILNILCTVAFVVMLFVLSHKTKAMFTLVNKTQMVTETVQPIEENKTKENEQ